jgi:transposase
LGTKIHLLTDGSGCPLRFILTGGQVNDCTQALPLLEGMNPKAVIADKAYDRNQILSRIQELGAVAVIPPTATRKIQREYDRRLYRQRNCIERTFRQLKQFRRIATRFDRKAAYFLAALQIAAFAIWG